MSIRNDHGAYWENDEGFVLPVARLIDILREGLAGGIEVLPRERGDPAASSIGSAGSSCCRGRGSR